MRREHELRTLQAQLPGQATQAAAVALAHLVLELREFGATGDAAPLNALWPRLRALLQALAGGSGVDGSSAQLLQNVDGFFG